MTFTIEQIIGFFGSLFIGLIGFVFQGFSKRVDKIETKQNSFELLVANDYVKDGDLKEVLQPLFKKLDKIEEKVDKANFELAHKADRTQ
jgi:tetrahydromethanopterin S-methyltransferase subunit G